MLLIQGLNFILSSASTKLKGASKTLSHFPGLASTGQVAGEAVKRCKINMIYRMNSAATFYTALPLPSVAGFSRPDPPLVLQLL